MKEFSALKHFCDHSNVVRERDNSHRFPLNPGLVARRVLANDDVIVKKKPGNKSATPSWPAGSGGVNASPANEHGRANWLQVFHQHQMMLRGYIANIVRSDFEAEDLLQDTFMRLWKSNRSEEIRSPRAFIFRTARNLALDSLRRKKVRGTHAIYEDMQEELSDQTPSSEQTIAARQELDFVIEAIKQLPPKCQEVFLQRKLYGLSHREIASQLGISVRTVENHVAKGMRECRAHLRNSENGQA